MDEQPQARRPAAALMALGGLIGVGVGFVALLLAVMSAGAGHGDYAAARALFPVPMLTTLLEGDTIGPLSISLALAQFPLLGALAGWCRHSGRRAGLVVAGAIHLVAVAVAFSGVIPNFS